MRQARGCLFKNYAKLNCMVREPLGILCGVKFGEEREERGKEYFFLKDQDNL
jgi:hypothetical protein